MFDLKETRGCYYQMVVMWAALMVRVLDVKMVDE